MSLEQDGEIPTTPHLGRRAIVIPNRPPTHPTTIPLYW
jgi:hypothetical protein